MPHYKLPRWFAYFIARPRVSRIALTLATIIDRPLMRLSGGRLRLSFVVPVTLLRCRGAKTGLVREVPLLYAPDGADLLLVEDDPSAPGGRRRLRAGHARSHCAEQVGRWRRAVIRLEDGRGRRALTAVK